MDVKHLDEQAKYRSPLQAIITVALIAIISIFVVLYQIYYFLDLSRVLSLLFGILNPEQSSR